MRGSRSFAIIVVVILIAMGIYFVISPSLFSSKTTLSDGLELQKAHVDEVVDGDTCWVTTLPGGNSVKVRFTGVNTPELNGDEAEAAEEAKDYTVSEIEGKDVWLVSETDGETDKYGRTLAYVWLVDPSEESDLSQTVVEETINGKLLSNGYAETMTIEPNTTFAEEFEEAEQEAAGK
ncbi:MAG: thermonuclease family protein [Coriobacteriales bacterium]|jgi:micrococcal nuclease